MSWTDERVAFIKTEFLVAERSAGQIALLLGDVTRSAVISKLNRLGIRRPAVRRMRIKPPVEAGERQAQKPSPPRSRSAFRALLTVPKLSEITSEIALLEAGGHHCRWIEGRLAGASYVCGKPKRLTGAFCEDHAARAYRRQTRSKPTSRRPG